MLIYKCKSCGNLLCETSVCPICGTRTEIDSSKIFWNKEANTPCFFNYTDNVENVYIGSDLRPVFPEERLLIELLLDKPFVFANKSIWNIGGNRYVVDGKKFVVPFADLIKKTDVDRLLYELSCFKERNEKYIECFLNNDFIKNFILLNKSRLNQITDEAENYIREIAKDYSYDEMFVSFSGGKDSTVTSSLVMKALNSQKIIHIFGDTTLEYPKTYEYIKRFKKFHGETPVLIAKNLDQNFNDLCDLIGPPSRVMRWCCTVFKTGAISKKIENTFLGKTKILSFQGIRRNESKARAKYERESFSPKITKQLFASPIIDWLDFDVWLYILSNKIDINDAYKEGFSRVGCWCCPNLSSWSNFLAKVYMNDQYTSFNQQLYNFAKKVGKNDWKEYIDSGKWKARQGGQGIGFSQNTVVSFKPCAFDENSYNFSLTKPINDQLYTLFKPFGTLNFDLGNKRIDEVFVMDKSSNQPLLKISGKKSTFNLRVTILLEKGAFRERRNNEMLIRNQITKFQTCIGCSACESICKFNALKIINQSPGEISKDKILYLIDSEKCRNCLECVTHFSGGCYMKKVLRIKKV